MTKQGKTMGYSLVLILIVVVLVLPLLVVAASVFYWWGERKELKDIDREAKAFREELEERFPDKRAEEKKD